jgi:hypothetical protein
MLSLICVQQKLAEQEGLELTGKVESLIFSIITLTRQAKV